MESVDEKRKRLQEKLKNREFSARILESLSYEKSIGEDFFYKKEEYNEIENYIEDYLSTGIAENFIIEFGLSFKLFSIIISILLPVNNVLGLLYFLY